MNFVARIALALGCLLFGAEAPASMPAPAPANLQELDAQLAKAFAAAKIPGGAVAVIEDGRVALVKGYGYADAAKRIPATPETMFRAGSISKSFTSIAVMTLVEQGKLALDARLADLAPEIKFKNNWESTDPVRLAHLLEHTTGWSDVPLRLYGVDGRGWTLLRTIQEASSRFVCRWPPGKFGVYNNVGPTVAGYLVEKASGQGFAAYMRDHVLRPMGMATADFDLSPDLESRLAKSYDPSGRETPYQYLTLRPAGALSASAQELAQLVRFYLGRGTVDGHQILTPQSVDRIEHSETSWASRLGLSNGYGLGNSALMDTGETFRGHNGAVDSFTSVYGYSVRDNAGYVLLANGGQGVNYGTPISELLQNYLTRAKPAVLPPPQAIDDAQLARYAGFYRAVTVPSNFLRPFIEILGGLTSVSAGHGQLVIDGDVFVPTGPHIFRKIDRDQPNAVFAEKDGAVYKIGQLNAEQKVPVWLLAVIFAVGGLLAIGLLGSLIMILVWLVVAVRRRPLRSNRLLLPLWPLLSIMALMGTLGLPVWMIASYGPGPALAHLAERNAYTEGAFVFSILFPLFAGIGLWKGWNSADAKKIIRIYVCVASVGLLLAAAYAASIGWVGIRTWMM